MLHTSHPMCVAHPYEAIQAAESLVQFKTLILAALPLLTFAYLLRHLITEAPAPPKSHSILPPTLPPPPPYRDPSPPHAWGGEATPVFYTGDIPN